MYDLIIAGAGPAGLSAAIYAQRARLNYVILEKTPMGGGQITETYEVDNYPGMPGIRGFELALKLRSHAADMGAEIRTAEIVSVKKENEIFVLTTAEQAFFETRSLIWAAGAAHKPLGVPGEETFAGRGVSYCATCDGAFFREKNVAVVGGGNTALEDALFLSRMCKNVTILVRRDELRAAKALQEQVFSVPNITVRYQTQVRSFEGEMRLARVNLADTKADRTMTENYDGVFIAVGILPHTDALAGLADLDENGFVIAGEDTASSQPGLFAAGDVRTKQLRQVVTAAADGACAAASAERWLRICAAEHMSCKLDTMLEVVCFLRVDRRRVASEKSADLWNNNKTTVRESLAVKRSIFY